jgi:hypothetical protein
MDVKIGAIQEHKNKKNLLYEQIVTLRFFCRISKFFLATTSLLLNFLPILASITYISIPCNCSKSLYMFSRHSISRSLDKRTTIREITSQQLIYTFYYTHTL